MKCTITFFENQYDTRTDRVKNFDSFGQMINCLREFEDIPCKKSPKMPRICPAVFKKGTTRANDNVECWGGWAAIDIDCSLPDDFEKYIRQIAEPFNFYCHSTGSSTKEKPKMRLLLELDERPEGDTIKHLWYALQKHFRELGDEQTKDYSRMYMPPGDYEGSYRFSFMNLDGEPVDVTRLITKYPYTEKTTQGFVGNLPEELQKRFLTYKKDQLNNTDYAWSSWHDCPFFPKKLAQEYNEIEAGWYHQIYRIMVSIAASATAKGYPITEQEIVKLVKEFDRMNGNWYEKRPFKTEARRALNYVLSTS